MSGGPHRTRVVLRPAAPGDTAVIASIWWAGWREAHEGRVPAALQAHRSPEQFSARIPALIETTVVAVADDEVAGFVVSTRDEVEQLYVSARNRGTGVAALLLARAEQVIGGAFPAAFLAVVDSNTRARRFYERHGWYDAGPFDYRAWTPDGTAVAVPCRRYEKWLVDRHVPLRGEAT